MKILVTGGAGFIGANLSLKLVELGHEVTVFDNFITGNRKYLENFVGDIVHADVTDAIAVMKAMEGKDVVFHLAANANVPVSTEFPALDFNANVIGGYNVLRSAIERDKSPIVIFTSSACVYGRTATPGKESDPICPISPYGASKAAVEALCMGYHNTYGLKVVAFRLSNTYGRFQHHYVMMDLYKKLMRNKENLVVIGNGLQIRDYVYIDDTINALVGVLQKPEMYAGRILNISTGVRTSVNDIVKYFCEALKVKPEILHTEKSWIGDVPFLSANSLELTKLGWSWKVSLPVGIGKFIEYAEQEIGII
jgi:UDP-glucose 4-epimerase